MNVAKVTERPSYRELTRRYWRWEAGGVLLIALGFGLSWWGLLTLAAWWFAPDEGTFYWLSPSAVVWGVPAFFMGILMATWPTDIVFRRLLGDRYPEFRDYQTRKFGYDGRAWMPLFYLFFGSASTVLVALLLDTYVFFGPRSIEINDVWALQPYRFTYDEVMEIRVADWRETTDGELLERFTVALYFADGSVWSSNGDRWFAGRERMRDIVAYVSARAGIPAVELGVLDQIELAPTADAHR